MKYKYNTSLKTRQELLSKIRTLFYKLQARNQEFFGAEKVSWNRGTSINVSCTTHKRNVSQGTISAFFLQDALKIAL